ncbi:MAG: hypothetical protein KDA83_03920 [Planctomycetales bacterium]|nr:hypothetical protein [Planctomycetales bacterium]
MSVRFTMGTLMLCLAAVASGCSVPALRSAMPTAHNLPPAQMLMQPGPGVGGPGPGVIPNMPPMGMGPGMGMGMGMGMGPGMGYDGGMQAATAQVHFKAPVGMEIRWDVGGVGQYDSEPLVVPGIQNFPENGVYRLKVTGIEGREDERLYPTLEVAPINARTAAYLAHTPIPIHFTEQDFDQALSGNFVTKVIYVPDPEFQELAIGGVDTLVSTRLDPGVDPIVEADHRGAILAVIRLGRKDMELEANELGVMQTNYQQGLGIAPGYSPVPFNQGGAAPGYISGVTGPAYGMPITGTPIGLPGPPHIPLGVPAGLQQHTIHNHTPMHIPGPTPQLDIHLRQDPGLSYPRPVDTVRIREQTIRPLHNNMQPPADMVHGYPPGAGGYCPPGGGY